MTRLTNFALDFVLDPEEGFFFLQSLSHPGASIKRARFNLSFDVQSDHPAMQLDSTEQGYRQDPKFGPVEFVSAIYRTRSCDLKWRVEFALPARLPLLLQRMEVVNLSDQIVHPERMVFGKLLPGELAFGENRPRRTAFYSNGWQSWSPSGTWQSGEKQQRSWLRGLSYPMLYHSGTPITRGKSEFSSDMFGALIDHEAQVGLISGFLSQKEQFGALVSTLHPEPDLQVWANADSVDLLPGVSLKSDWLSWHFFDSSAQEPFRVYFEAVALENEVQKRIETPAGWCSWYYYFQNINPSEIRKNLRAVCQHEGQLPLKYFQIDDGFEQDVGNWFEFDKLFPEGVTQLAEEIRHEGLIPGIWLAPFILQPGSKLIRRHPNWLLRKRDGRPVNSGFVWNGLGRALDLTHPDVQGYVRDVIRTAVTEWGYPYLKLDFLYSAALPGSHHDPTKTRAQILRQALELIREEAGPDAILLGCGCPIGSGIGVFNMMRISADVSPEWLPNAFGLKTPFRSEPNMPCARNAIQNILTRAPMDPHWWVNDPDCLLVRADSKLTLPEVQSLASAISLSGGAMLLSDDMTKLDDERLKLAASLLPTLPPGPQVVDLFRRTMPSQLRQTLHTPAGPRHVIALFNWADAPRDIPLELQSFGLEEKEWLMREFWTGQCAELGGDFLFHRVPPHGVRLATLSPKQSPAYVGSSLHLSQGIELKSWQATNSELLFELDLGREAQGSLFIACEAQPSKVTLDESEIYWTQESKNLISVPLKIAGKSSIKINFFPASE